MYYGLGQLGIALAMGIAAVGSAIGIGIAGQASIGAWKKCYMSNKAAPFILTVFAGAPLTQTIYGFLLMQQMKSSDADPMFLLGLAGAAISATVNELAGPLLGNFLFMILAIVLLVFGHGLNMILNVLSVIVHGIRLNTLEFSSHLGMSWSGHKFKAFEE